MTRLLRSIAHANREQGQALVEFSLIIAFIAVVCVVAATALGLVIAGGFGGIVGSF